RSGDETFRDGSHFALLSRKLIKIIVVGDVFERSQRLAGFESRACVVSRRRARHYVDFLTFGNFGWRRVELAIKKTGGRNRSRQHCASHKEPAIQINLLIGYLAGLYLAVAHRTRNQTFSPGVRLS